MSPATSESGSGSDDRPEPAPTGDTKGSGGAWRALALGLIAAIVVIGAFAFGSTRGDGATTTGTGEDADRLTVVGSGESSAVPDELTFTLRVSQQRDDVSTAMAQTNTTTTSVIDALRDAGVGERDLRSSGLSVGSVQVRDPETRESRTVGYKATHTLAVKVEDLDAAGRIIDAGVAAGGDAVSVDDLRLSISDPAAALEQARADAVADARERAEQYPPAADRGLGQVIVVREGGDDDYYGDDAAYSPAAAFDSAGGLSIAAGEQTVSARVEVVWSLD